MTASSTCTERCEFVDILELCQTASGRDIGLSPVGRFLLYKTVFRSEKDIVKLWSYGVKLHIIGNELEMREFGQLFI